MHIRNTVEKVAFISDKPPLVVEHAFPLMEFVGLSAHVTELIILFLKVVSCKSLFIEFA